MYISFKTLEFLRQLSILISFYAIKFRILETPCKIFDVFPVTLLKLYKISFKNSTIDDLTEITRDILNI